MTDEEFSKLKDGDLIESFGDHRPILNKPERTASDKRRWSVRPYARIRDFNQQGADEYFFEDNPPESALEVGLKFTF